MAVTYVTLYPRGGNSTTVQVVEGSQLHLIYAEMGFSATPSVPGPPVRPDPFPQYVHDDEVAALVAGAAVAATDPVVAGLVEDGGGSQTGVALRAAFVQVAEAPPTPQRFGATGGGTVDDTTALRNFLAAGYSEGYIPPGTYNVTGTLTQPAGMAVKLAPGATLKATATIAGPIWDTPVGTQFRRGLLSGGVFACNNLAQTGIYPRWVADFGLYDVTVLDPAGDAIVIGDPAAASSSYGVFGRDVRVDRPSRTAKVTGSRGIWTQNAGDCKFAQSQIVGQDIGVRADSGYHQFINVMAWGYSNSLPSTCFDDNGTGNSYIDCMADTPTVNHFRLRGVNTRIIGGKSYLNSTFGVDNTVNAIQVDPNPAFYSVIGHHFQGNDSTHRIAKDYNTVDTALSNVIQLGNQYTNVVTQASPQSRLPAGLGVGGGITSFNQLNVFANELIYATAGNTRYITYGTGGSVAGASSRWQAGANATAEGGSNAGSDYDIVSRTDAGAFLATVMHLIRANGVAQFASGGVATRVKGGTPSDADYAVPPPDGTVVIDSAGSKIWARVGGAWKSATLA